MGQYQPPQEVVSNAKQALEWRKKYPTETADSGERVGWTRASQLASGKAVSEDIVQRMANFFQRHDGNEHIDEKYKNEPWKDNGYLMYLAWGGDRGKTWSIETWNQIKQQRENKSLIHSMQLEYKSFKIENINDVNGEITGYGVTYNNKDRVQDIILQGALTKSIESWKVGQKIEFLSEHNSFIKFNENIDSIEDDEKGAVIKARVRDKAKQQYPNYYKNFLVNCKNGNGFLSIGYYPVKAYIVKNDEKIYITPAEWDNIRKENRSITRYLEEIKAFEFSFTTNPANMQAKVLEIKTINEPSYIIKIGESWDSAMANQRWRAFTNSQEQPSEDYKKGFLYFDEKAPENFGSYHLQIIDIDGAEPFINENAVIAVYGTMKGARRGLEIVPNSEMPKLMEVVKGLYEKINETRMKVGIALLNEPDFKKLELEAAIANINAFSFAKKMIKDLQEGKYIKLTDRNKKDLCKQIAKLYDKKNNEKTLDIQNNDVNEGMEPPSAEALKVTDTVTHDTRSGVKSLKDPFEDFLNQPLTK